MAPAISRRGDNALVIQRPNPGARIRLVCMPYAGANAQAYRDWAAELPRDVELIAYEPPGHGLRFGEPAPSTIPGMVAAAGAAIANVAPPFVVFGHSLGAIVTFELAHWLRANGRPMPERILLSAGCAPGAPSGGRDIHALPGPEFIEGLRDLNGTPAEVLDNAELMEMLIPVLRADFTASETWSFDRATPPLSLPIAAFGGLSDPEAPRASLEAWRAFTTGPFSLRLLPGDHFYLQGPSGALLRELVSRELDASGR